MSRILLVPILLLLVAPTVWAQGGSSQDSTAYCDSLCLVPLPERIVERNPLFMCDCMVIIGIGGSGGGNDEPMTPAQILDRMWASYEQRVANVSDYTVVQTTSSVPMPVVLYYEKEVIDGHSTFQLISPAELADREAAANGHPTSEEMGAGIVALADMLGGLVGGGGSPPGEEPPPVAPTPGSGQEPPGALPLQMIIEGIRDFGEGLQEGRGRFEQQQGLMDDLFWNQDLIDRMRNTGKQEFLSNGEYISCDVLYVDDRDGPVMDLGPGYEGYSIWYARAWISDEDSGFFEPIAMEVNMKTPSGEHVTLTRTHRDYRQDGPDGPIVPRRTSMTMDGIAGLVQGAVDNVWTEVQSIHEVLMNGGPPTTEESAALIGDAMERLGL